MSLPFTLDDVAQAYDKTGLRPARSIWFDDTRHCGCVLYVLVAAKFGAAIAGKVYGQKDEAAFVAEKLGISSIEAECIAAGFDDDIPLEDVGRTTKAHDFGQAAWERVKHLADAQS